MRRRILALPVAFAIVAIPGALTAQACVGSPIAESFNGVSAQIGFPQDAMIYGASVRHNMNGPVTMSAGYTMASIENVDPKQHGLAADASYELEFAELPLSACPTVGLAYTRMSDESVALSTLSVPVGVSIGRAFEVSNGGSVIPHVMPHWTWTKFTLDPATGDAISDDDSVFGALFGVTFATHRFYVGGGLSWVNEDGQDAIFSITAGMPFSNPF